MSRPQTEEVDSIGELAQFTSNITFQDIPEQAIRLTERCFIDTLGVGIAGSVAEAGSITATVTQELYGDGPARIFGRSQSAPLPEAVFVNATASHALDYDDVSSGMAGHPSTTMVAPILGVGEVNRNSGKELITAYVAGFETQCYVAAPNLNSTTVPGLHVQGWHPTPIFGSFGAAAAVSHLLGLDTETTKTALNITASMTSGLVENIGSLTKPMHSGHAARCGLYAAYLADANLDAVDTAIQNGFLPNYTGVEEFPYMPLPLESNEWALLTHGIDIKKFPSCYLTHTTIKATSTLVNDHDISASDVSGVHVTVPEHIADILVYDNPTTEAEAKFSIPYTATLAILYDYIGIDEFRPATITNPEIQELLDRVSYDIDASLEAGSSSVTVDITLANGETITRQEDTPPAPHDDPLSDKELTRKFVECATHAVEKEDAIRAHSLLDSLRQQENPSEIIELIS